MPVANQIVVGGATKCGVVVLHSQFRTALIAVD